MTMNVVDPVAAPHTWGATAEITPSAIPSWMAPRHPKNEKSEAKTEGFSLRAAMAAAASAEYIPEPSPSEAPVAKSITESALRPPRTPVISSAPEAPQYPDLREENAMLQRQLASALAALTNARNEVLAASEVELVKLATVIAEKVVGRELTADPSLVVGLAKEGIAALGDVQDVSIALAPDLAQQIADEAWEAAGVTAKIEVDAQLPAGACEVRTKMSSVEVDVHARLDAVIRELGVDTKSDATVTTSTVGGAS